MAITISEFTPAGGTGTSLQVTRTLTAGSALVVVGSSTEGGSTISVSDGTNTYTERQSVSHGSSGIRTRMWTANNVAGGSTTITMSNLAGYAGTLQAFEVLGVDTSAYSASDINSQSVTSVYCAQAGGVTVPSGGAAVACLVCDRDITALSMSGYTSGTNVNNGIVYSYARWQVFAGGASGERAAGTLTTNGHTTGVIAVLAAASGGAATSDTPIRVFRPANFINL